MPDVPAAAVPDLPVAEWDPRRLRRAALGCAVVSGILAGLWQRWQGDGLAETVLVGLSAACFGPLIVAALGFLALYIVDAVIGFLLSAAFLIATLIGFLLHFPRPWMLALVAMNERSEKVTARVTMNLAKPILWFRKPSRPTGGTVDEQSLQ